MKRALAFAAVLGACLFVALSETRADEAAETVRRAQVVARIGPTRTVSVADLEDRLAALPAFQRATFGLGASLDAASVRRGFLEEVLVPEALQSIGAERDKLDQQLPTSYALERVRSQSTIRVIRARVGLASAIPMEDVQKYYDDNRERYDTPERYQIWRILCKTRDDAQAVLDAARREPTPKKFGELAREHSVDKASNLREGNLGFIAPDGTSNEPGLRIDVALVRAVQGLRDGEIVAAPVPEGENFSVVWRRGTIAAMRRSVEQAAAQIRDTLWKARVKTQTDSLLAELRTAKLRDRNDALIDALGGPPVGDAGHEVVRPTSSAAASTTPRP